MTAVRTGQRRRVRRAVGWALLFSLLIHLVSILAVAWVYVMETPPPPDRVEEIEITLIEPPPPPPREVPRFVETDAPETAPPEQAAFESDRNTAAASPETAQGDLPVPTQDGREQPFLELTDTELAMAQPSESSPAPETPPAEPSPPAPPEAAKPAEEKPADEKPAAPDALLAMNQPRREEEKEPREKPQPPAPPPARPAFQRQARATRLRGSLSSDGSSASVNAVRTPLGRYQKAISDAIGSSWYYYIGPRLDMFSYGTVSVVFIVDKNGKVRRPRVIENTSNESFEIVTVESILAAEIPPIPPDVLPVLEGGQIEIDYTFSIITN